MSQPSLIQASLSHPEYKTQALYLLLRLRLSSTVRTISLFSRILAPVHPYNMRFTLVALLALAATALAQTYVDFPECAKKCLRDETLICGNDVHVPSF